MRYTPRERVAYTSRVAIGALVALRVGAALVLMLAVLTGTLYEKQRDR